MIKLSRPIDLRPECPSYERLLKCLKKLPDGEVYDTAEILSKSGVSTNTVEKHKNELEAYRHRAGKSVYWGTPKAIREFKRRLANL